MLAAFLLSAVFLRAASNPHMEFKARGPFYMIPLQVGMPPQEVNVSLDTTGLLTFLYDDDAHCYGEQAGQCYPHRGFSPKKSNTFKSLNTQEVFECPLGEARGTRGTDVFTFGPYEMIDPPATIGVADRVITYLNRKIQTSGFISMYAPVEPLDSPEASHMQTLSAESQAAIVSLFTPRCGTEMHTVTIGKADDTNCESEWTDFQLVPDGQRRWVIQFDSISWGPSIHRENVQAILSTAADYVVAPRGEVETMRQMMNAVIGDYHEAGLSETARIDCSQRKNGPFIRFDAHGRSFYMRPSQYVKQYKTGVCILNVYPDGPENRWTLPYMFFQGYCVRFDFGQKLVGFAFPKNFGSCSRTDK
ncbi:Acid protease [Aphelenchoides fujianensis]|nr:Acid protease [Aphelenchoides fujianensis]